MSGMLSRPGEIVRRFDPDRFFASLFAPAVRREALWALYAFNHEVARAAEVAREPFMAAIRLQWWREVVEGADRRHEVATPLRELLAAGLLDRDGLLALIVGREQELEPLPDLAAWTAYLRATAGGLAAEAGRVLGASEAEMAGLRDLGAAYGAAGVLRSVAAQARMGRCLLPLDVLDAAGLTPEAVVAAPDFVAPVRAVLAEVGLDLLRDGRRVRLRRGIMAAGAVAATVAGDLRRQAGEGTRALRQARVALAMLAGRV